VCSRFYIDLLGPTTAETIIKSIGNPIDFPLRAARSSFGDQTVPAGIAGAVYVEKGYTISFTEELTFHVAQLSPNPA
jgi:hypothetical protein